MKNKRTVLITGAAGGIGYGVAEAFAGQGDNIVLTDIQPEKLTKARQKLAGEYGVEVLALEVDGSDETAVKKSVNTAVEKFGHLDVLVNNAQASKSGLPLIEHSLADFALAIETGLYGTFFFMKHSFDYLKARQGCVINFASGAGISGGSGQASYAAAKEGIRALSRVAAREWGIYNINVNVVCPLAMTKQLENWKEKFPEQYEANIKNIPLGRFGSPRDDIGAVCVFLASSGASYITGDTISVQGGSGLRP